MVQLKKHQIDNNFSKFSILLESPIICSVQILIKNSALSLIEFLNLVSASLIIAFRVIINLHFFASHLFLEIFVILI